MSIDLLELKEKDTLSYRNCSDETIKDAQWGSVTIDSCIIMSCTIKNVMAKNADVLATKCNNSSFRKTDLSHSDLCSCIFQEINFQNVLFDTSAIRDCEFESCVFIDCSFEHSAMTNTEFINCKFENIVINQSSSYLNKFTNCTFENSSFHGNFFYSMFLECKNIDKLLSERLLTYNFLNTAICEIQYKGEIIEKLKNDCMFLNMEIYRLNTKNIMPDRFLIESLIAIHKLLSMGIILRSEQIEFVHHVAFYYIKCGLINTISIVQAINIIDEIFINADQEDMAFSKARNLLNQIKNELFLEYINRCNNTPAFTIDFKNSLPCIYKITYEKEPEVEISQIINTVLQRMGIDKIKATRIRTMRGSFIELVSFFEQAEPIINLITTLITGAAIPIIIEKMKKKNEAPSKAKEIHNPINITVNNNNITVLNNCIIESNSVNQAWSNAAVSTLIDLGITEAHEYCGYSKNNIRSIEKLDTNANDPK